VGKVGNNNMFLLSIVAKASSMQKLRVNRLHNNNLVCDCHLAWLAKWLRAHPTLALFAKCHDPPHLRAVEIAELQESDFTCNGVPSAQVQQPAQDCIIPPVCPSKCVCTDTIVDCRDKGLTDLPANIPESTTELRLEQNQITEIRSKVFAELKKLRRIDLSNNQISRVAADAFVGLENLNSLVLYGNKIDDLPPGIFNGLVSLQLLLLNANRITCVRDDTFKDLHSLNLLSLYDNKIQSLANATFTPLKNIQTLHLARNPFICDCNLRWLSEYLHSHPIETSGARCESPRRMNRKKIGVIRHSKFKCKGSEEYRTKKAGKCVIDNDCPEECECEGTVVDCTARKLTMIPEKLPSYATEIKLGDNEIEKVEAVGAFEKLSMLKKLDLRNNRINEVGDKAFEGAVNLEDLTLTENKISTLNDGMFHGLRNLKTLMLRTNKIGCISNKTFVELENLRLVSLYDNQIRCIQPGSFDRLKYLSNLNLLTNPFNCNCHLNWLGDWLQKKNIVSGNPRCETPSAFQNSPIQDLKPTDFKCETVSNEVGCHSGPPPCCTNEGLEDCTKNQVNKMLQQPPENCDENDSEESCDPRSYCPPGCKCTGTEVRCSHQNMKTLPIQIPLDTTELYLDSNGLEQLPPGLHRLTKLQSLDLSNNGLVSLPEDAFANLTQLHTLILSYNKLQCVQQKTFSGLANLKVLSLHGNDLSSIPYGAFNDMVSLTHLALGNNPLYCDCNLKWLSDWIKEGYKEPGIAACQGPEGMGNNLLLTTPSFKFQCYEKADPTILAKCNVCYTYPCQHSGTCHLVGFKQYRCECPASYHGEHCEHEIDACFGNPCDNGGTCKVLDDYGRFSCDCPRGFEGDRCETNINDCVDHRCQNNASCVDEVERYSCACEQGYTGEHCEKKVSYCVDFNPCANGARCRDLNTDYQCQCPNGFEGRNCTTNINDCQSHICQNGASCEDGLDSYKCICPRGYSGRYCEIAPMILVEYPQSSVCQEHDCKNGGLCFQPPGSPEYICKCPPGFDGKKCEKLSSISFKEKDAYVELSSLTHQPKTNVTIVVSTEKKQGVIMYHGFDQHLAVEVFRGRIRVSYDIGNYPVSTMFSYEQISDGQQHTIELLLNGKNLTMVIDGGSSRTIINEGDRTEMEMDEPMYVGGLPADVKDGAFKKWHIRDTDSFIGCFHKLYVNGRMVDFSMGLTRYKLIPGCPNGEKADPCDAHMCKFGSCTPLEGMSYKCRCRKGYSGAMCDVEPTCQSEEFREVYADPNTGCKTRKKVKHRRCNGTCNGNRWCCEPKKIKTRRVWLFCEDGSNYIHEMPVIRKCGCNKCDG